MRPLLSICIPTYNRSPNLKRTLESIVCSDDFSEDVEVVVSDNASTDDTEEVANFFSGKYANVKYFRNEVNIRDSNFPLALDRGTGYYLKLNNDNRELRKGALKYMLSAIKDNLNDRNPIFFTNCKAFHARQDSQIVKCSSLDDLVIHLSYNCTGIWLFGAWKDDWNLVSDKMKYSHLQLSQQDWFYQIVVNKGGCLLYTGVCSDSAPVGPRRGYNWFQVQVDNYYKIMRPYLEKNLLSKSAFAIDHRFQLKRIKLIWTSKYTFNLMPDEWQLDTTGAFSVMWRNFKKYPYFYLWIITSPFWMLEMLSRRVVRKILIKKTLTIWLSLIIF